MNEIPKLSTTPDSIECHISQDFTIGIQNYYQAFSFNTRSESEIHCKINFF